MDASILQVPRRTGSQVYAFEMLSRLPEVMPTAHIHLAGRMGRDATPALAALERHPSIDVTLSAGRVRRHGGTAWSALRHRAAAHYVVNGNTGGVRTPMPCPTAWLLHDCRFALLPELYGHDARAAFLRMGRRAVRRHELTVTGSQSVREEIVDVLGADEDRVVVASEGHEHLVQTEESPPAGIDSGPYLLVVNPSDPRKDTVTTISAFEQYVGAFVDDELRLVIAGLTTGQNRAIEAQLSASKVRDRIALLGFVSTAELTYLYRHAEALVYCSRYEGFGIPILEALVHGTPIIASDIRVFREVARRIPLFVPIADVGAQVAAMHVVRSDASVGARARAQGPHRASQFSWTDTARATALALQSL